MQPNASPSDPKQAHQTGTLLTVEDVQNKLQVSIRTVRELTASGRLAVVKIGRSVRVREQDLEAFIESNLVK